MADLKTRRLYNTAANRLASHIGTWQMRKFCRFFSVIRAVLAESGTNRPEPLPEPPPPASQAVGGSVPFGLA